MWDEIAEGMPAHRERLREAKRAWDYMHLKGHQHLPARPGNGWDSGFAPHNAGDAETTWHLPLLHAAVNALTQHTYNPGPTRAVTADSPNDAATWSAWLDRVYASNQVNSRIFQTADVYSTLHGAAAIEVRRTANPADPIRLDVWGGDEFVTWAPGDDPANPVGVATLSRDAAPLPREAQQDGGKGHWVCVAWTAEERRVYRGPGGAAPGKLTLMPKESGENPYGTLPFVFATGRPVVRDLWESAIGDFLARINMSADRELSDLARLADFDLPIGFLADGQPMQSIIARPGHFNHLLASKGGTKPEPFYLKSEHDANGRLAALQERVYLTLEMIGVPRTAIRLDLSSAMSGVAIIAESAPLLARAKLRQEAFAVPEQQLARKCLQIGLGIVAQALASVGMQLFWPDVVGPVPVPEKDSSDMWMLEQGLISKVNLAMTRFGFTRAQAIAHLQQVEADNAAIAPAPTPAPTPTPELAIAPEPEDDPGEEVIS